MLKAMACGAIPSRLMRLDILTAKSCHKKPFCYRHGETAAFFLIRNIESGMRALK